MIEKMDKKAYQAALRNHLPMYWEYKTGWFRLHAITAQFESGKQRTRKIFSTESAEAAINISLELLLKSWHAPRLDVSALHKNIWGLPQLADLRTAVSKRVPSTKQPDWTGFAEEMKRQPCQSSS